MDDTRRESGNGGSCLARLTIAKTRELIVENFLNENFSKGKEGGEFWHELAKQEFIHHQWLAALFINAKKDKTYFNATLFNAPAVDTSLKYIEKLQKNARTISRRAALNAALDIEKAMIEHNYFDLFIPENQEVTHILLDLKNETQKHIEMIIEEIQKISE